MADDVQEVTLRISAKLLTRLNRLADEACQSPDTYIESALSHVVRGVTSARRALKAADAGERTEAPVMAGGYL